MSLNRAWWLVISKIHIYALTLKDIDLPSIYKKSVDYLVSQNIIKPEIKDEIYQKLCNPEGKASYLVGNSVSIPYLVNEHFDKTRLLLIRLKRGINLDAPDGIPIKYMFILLGPPKDKVFHLKMILSITQVGANPHFRYELKKKFKTKARVNLEQFIYHGIFEYDPSMVKKTEEDKDHDPGLDYSPKLFSGILADIKRRLPYYKHDFLRAFQPKVLSATLFLFFACHAAAITFGGLMGIYTGGQIGAIEMILATSVCGVIYTLFAGQPIIILGGTGPLLIFTTIIFKNCARFDIPFLPTYALIGLWAAIFTILWAITNLSVLMKYFTRFTDEIFGALISFIFISEAIYALADPMITTSGVKIIPLLSLLIGVGTFFLAIGLVRFRKSDYLNSSIRNHLSDFGPVLSIIIMTGLILYSGVELSHLKVPETFSTTSGRSWFVNPFDVPTWIIFATIIPGFFASLLIYLDQNITSRLVNSPDNKLIEGPAYHLDLLVVGILVAICSLFGLPWLVAATVRSLNHLKALSTMDEVISTSFKRENIIIHVAENRVSGLVIHILMGISLFFLVYLKLVPIAVLYGIFFYMGIVSLRGNEFFDRMALFVMDPALYPPTHYMKKVPRSTINKFTFIQFSCLLVLWVVKVSFLGFLFPLVLALLAPLRILLKRFFKKEDLDYLDKNF